MDSVDSGSSVRTPAYRQDRLNGVFRVRLSGVIDLDALMKLVPIERVSGASDAGRMLVDAREAEIHLSGADLHSLVAWLQRAAAQGRDLLVAFLEPPIEQLDLEMSMVSRLLGRIGISLRSFERLEDALDWLATSEATGRDGKSA